MATNPIPDESKQSDQNAELVDGLIGRNELCGISKQSGMADELERDRRAEDDAWNLKHGFPVNVWNDQTETEK